MSAASCGTAIETLVVCPPMLNSPPAQRVARRLAGQGTHVVEVNEDAFRSLSQASEPQGIGAVVRQRWHRLRDMMPGSELCWTIVDTVNSPGNLGTILRTSDAVGGAGAILLSTKTDPYDPAVLRATMGSIFYQKLVRATPREFDAFRRSRGMALIGTSSHADRDYRDLRYRPSMGIFMGCEQGGLSTEQMRTCDEVVRIPMVGRCDSLNVAVATGIVLYELYRKSEASIPTSAPGSRRGSRRGEKPCKSRW